jgi:hypothetical protein
VGSVEDDLQPAKVAGLVEELAQLRALTTQLRAENARSLRLLELTPNVPVWTPPPPGVAWLIIHPWASWMALTSNSSAESIK